QALERVLPWFAAFRVRLRRGVFWRYLEVNPATPIIYEEDDYPCRYIYAGQNRQYLFRVSHFENRINLEIFHVLTDGTGGMQFLQALCCQYLLLAHPGAFTPEQKARRWFAQHGADTEDSYVKNYTPTQKATFQEGRSYKLRGERNMLDALGVMHAYIPLQPLLQLCRQKGVSITQYLAACIGWAVYTEQLGARGHKLPVNIFLPVNLRKLFPSTTTLNFFSNIYVSLAFNRPGISFDEALAAVKRQFEEKVTRESMLKKISYTVGSGYSPFIRMVPLPIKNMALRAIFEASARSSTMGFSNLGSIQMPAEFAPYVTGVAFMLSSAPREPFKCAACSYGDIFTLSFTSMLRSTALQRAVVRMLSADIEGITIETNGAIYEGM
ncbi:MAG: hypothetical protein ACK5L3_11430, partial [Oscillospiraceae bacterium]